MAIEPGLWELQQEPPKRAPEPFDWRLALSWLAAILIVGVPVGLAMAFG